MRDAFGGIMNIMIVVIFFLLVEGILGMTVNYSKAFRMKNYVISTIEKYEATSCLKNQQSACSNEIVSSANKIGYSGSGLTCPHGYSIDFNGLYCFKSKVHSKGRYSYSVITQVDFNFPVINKILSFDFFQVHGDTRVIEVAT